MKRFCLFVIYLLWPLIAAAQFTTVTGAVTDPNGLPYAFGTISPTLVSSGSPTLSGFAYTPPTQPAGLDRNGKFVVRLADVTVLSPGGSTWSFITCSAVGTVSPSFGKGSVCFTVAGVSISGASQDIGATLTAAALPLTANFAGTSNGLPLNPLIGDLARFNVNADGLWDAVNAALPEITQVNALQGQANGIPNVTGPLFAGANDTNNLCACGTVTDVNPTATTGFGINYASTAGASTNTLIGVRTGENGNNSQQGMLSFYRWTLKIKFGTTTNARYWMGLGCWRAVGGNGNNGTVILNSAAYATDTPNKTTVGFRFSAGTDTHWQAISAVAGGSQTTVDTGITPDTNVHTYEMAPNAAGTAVFFFIDGVSVVPGGITTNLPLPAQAQDSWGDLFFTGDNKNTANAVNATFYFMTIAAK